jgi:hypothetical protein
VPPSSIDAFYAYRRIARTKSSSQPKKQKQNGWPHLNQPAAVAAVVLEQPLAPIAPPAETRTPMRFFMLEPCRMCSPMFLRRLGQQSTVLRQHGPAQESLKNDRSKKNAPTREKIAPQEHL